MRLKTFLILIIGGYVTFMLIQVFFTSKSHEFGLLWWTPFSSEDREVVCGNYRCHVSSNREYDHVKAFMFYGSSIDLKDLPFSKDKPWALYHEESPKNFLELRNENIQDLFNITSTFSRYSNLPLTLQYLKNIDELLTSKYFISIKEKNKFLKTQAPILYLQKDCETPIERDKYVKELMEYIDVDSYGDCLNNWELPKVLKLNGTYDLYQDELMELVGKYKFVIAIENAKCFDYITEKLWRPLIAGSIPIYMGSKSIKDWLPNKNSAILIEDFPNLKSLAEYIKLINQNDTLYNLHLKHKTDGIITNQLLTKVLSKGNYGINENNEENTVGAFECFVCKTVHSQIHEIRKKSVYDCEDLKSVDGKNDNFWMDIWKSKTKEAQDFVEKFKRIGYL